LFFLLFFVINLVILEEGGFVSSLSSFESGFDGGLLCQVSVRVHFFIIMVLFVLFDLELVLFLGFLLLTEVSF
jgi:NADH:ubiquinone oxidoreductase subunit 3 (subunit A)